GNGEKRSLRRSDVRHENAGAADETNDKQSDKGRRVIGALKAQILAADRAARIDGEIAAEHRPLAAIGTAPQKSTPHRDGKVAVHRPVDGWRGPGTCGSGRKRARLRCRGVLGQLLLAPGVN